MNYTLPEQMIVAAARLLKDGDVVYTGVGLPTVAAFLAKLTHAPHLTIVFETGIVRTEPCLLPQGVDTLPSQTLADKLSDVFYINTLAERGLVNFGFVGAGQLDRHGNINSTCSGDYRQPRFRFPGGGGACDIASLCQSWVAILRQKKIRFPECVDFVTGPGYLDGSPGARERAGLPPEAAKELDDLLATGHFVGIGEGFPQDPTLGAKHRRIDIHSRLDEISHFMEVARKYKVPVRYHVGLTMGYTTGFCRGTGANPETYNPMWVHDLAIEWPDVPIIFEHGGVQAWWWEKWYEECLNVAAATDNVYLETGTWWTELYDKPLRDPNIGAKKLLWGTDWGSSIPVEWQPGQKPETYVCQRRKTPPVRHQVDMFGWSLKQIGRLNIPQDDLNLILGGNAARLYRLKLPHTRLFPFVDE